MSLEVAIRDLTEVTRALLALRAEAIEKVSVAAAPAPKTGKAAAPKADPKAEEGREITDSPEDRKDAADAADAADADPVKDKIVEYIGATKSAEERDARKAKVAEILKKVGARKHSEIPADRTKAFINTIDKFIAEGDVLTPGEESRDEDDLLG